jgi:hypothetical protein
MHTERRPSPQWTLLCLAVNLKRYHVLQPAFRRVGRLLYSQALEAWAPPAADSSISAYMRAVAADLRYLERYLASTAADADDTLPAPEFALALFAGELAGKVRAIAEEIEARLQ